MKRRKMQLHGWYPHRERACVAQIKEFEQEYQDVHCNRSFAGVVPHAGWTFSGKLAGAVIRLIAQNRDEKPDTVVIYGGHLGAERVALLMSDDACETPLGDLLVDQEFTSAIREAVPTVEEKSYMVDNTIEIQLPFIKYYFGDVKIVGLRPPMTELAVEIGERVVEVADELGRSIAIVASTDLTHYGPNYNFTPKGHGEQAVEWVKGVNDKEAIEMMIACNATKLISHAQKKKSACSAGAPVAAIASAKQRAIDDGELVDYYTSYDVMPNASFVGYAGIVY